jgi:putative oxidoreductase
MKFFSWILRIVVAVILLQTLFFKFTGAEESVYIFSTVGAEPWGRYGSGIVELIAAVLVLVPSTAGYGAILTVGVATGAILSHLTLLGIEVRGDGGLLFGLAVTIFVCGLALLAIHRRELPIVGRVLEA